MDAGTWSRVDAGQKLKCSCGDDVFGEVLPGTIAYLMPAQRHIKPLPGCVAYLCRRSGCRRMYWCMTKPIAKPITKQVA